MVSYRDDSFWHSDVVYLCGQLSSWCGGVVALCIICLSKAYGELVRL